MSTKQATVIFESFKGSDYSIHIKTIVHFAHTVSIHARVFSFICPGFKHLALLGVYFSSS